MWGQTGDMADCRVRLMAGTCLVLLLLTATEALTWTSDIQDGDNLSSCVGNNVTFPWSFVTESKESVIVQFWFSNKSGSFASYFADRFITSWDRLTQAGPAGVTLSNISTVDDDTYGVSVMLYDGQEPLTQHINLTVAEPPRTTDGQLHVTEHAVDAGNVSRSYMRLQCGEFLTLGSPPVSVAWTDPSGHRLPSTAYHAGYFHLDLDPHARGGNYTCSVQSESKAAQCLASDSPLLMEAGYQLVTMETVGPELRQLRRIVEELSQQVALSRVTHTNTSGALRSTVTAFEQGQKNRTELLEGQVAELHTTVVEQNNTVSVLAKLVADLHDTSTELRQAVVEQDGTVAALAKQAAEQDTQLYTMHNVMSDLHTKNADLNQTSHDQSEQISSLQNQLADLHRIVLEQHQASMDQNTHISGLQNQMAHHNIQISGQQKQVSDQNTQISGLQKQVSDQNTQISGLQNQTTDQSTQISGLQKQVSDQNTQISGLLNQVSDQNNQISGLKKQTTDQNTKISGLQKQVSDQNTQISGLQKQTIDQNTLISDLQKQVSDQNIQISGLQIQTTDQNIRISELQNQTTDQNIQISGLQNQTTDQNTQISSLQNQVSDQSTKISSLRSDLHKANSDVDLKLDDLDRNLTLVTSQLIDMAALQQGKHRQLQARQDNLTSDIQAGTRQMTSLQNDVTTLQADISRGMTNLTTCQSDLTKLKTFASQVSKVYSNVAAYKPTAQSSTYPHGKADASLAVDLNLNTDFHQGSCTHTNDGENNPWWRVDLRQVYDVTVVLITNRGDCCGDRLKDFYVDVMSDDPVSNSQTPAVTCSHYAGVVANGVTVTLPCSKPIQGRYVRVRKSTNILQLCEVQVMAPVASWSP